MQAVKALTCSNTLTPTPATHSKIKISVEQPDEQSDAYDDYDFQFKEFVFSADEPSEEIEDQTASFVFDLPFKQGGFDHLCGLYAIVNGFNIAIQKLHHGIDIQWNELFSVLISKINKDMSLKHVILHGLTKPQFEICLHKTVRYMKKRHQLHTVVTWPWAEKQGLTGEELVSSIMDHMNKPGTGAIMRYASAHLKHWSAIQVASSDHIHFSDSTKLRSLAVKRFAFASEMAEHSKGCLCIGSDSFLTLQLNQST